MNMSDYANTSLVLDAAELVDSCKAQGTKYTLGNKM